MVRVYVLMVSVIVMEALRAQHVPKLSVVSLFLKGKVQSIKKKVFILNSNNSLSTFF